MSDDRTGGQDGWGTVAEGLLACARCGAPPAVGTTLVACAECGWEREMRGRTLSIMDGEAPASFDEKHDLVAEHNHHPVTWQFAYERQCELITSMLDPGRVVLDLGCGPEAPYERRPGAYIVGVDASLPSVDANPDLDLGLHTTAAVLPLQDKTVDVVIANYVFHHMIEETIGGSWRNVESAFAEVARVAKPGADVIVLEICPWEPTWIAECLGWRLARQMLGSRIDFLFWPVRRYRALGERVFPGARFEERRYGTKWWATFPPMIGLPRVKVPWILYPFHVCLFRWTLPTVTPGRLA